MIRLLLALLPLLCLAAAPDRPPVASTSRFTAVDLFIDPAGQPLAAYQIEFAAETGRISLVGVEAGEPGPYSKRPPYYDPAALAGHRIILGDYTLDPAAPKAKTRVARLMLEIQGDTPPQYVTKLMTAATPDGKPIAAKVSATGATSATQPRSGDKK
jgi:hypothetical protein